VPFSIKWQHFVYIDVNKIFTFASNVFIMGENLLSHPTIRSMCAWSVEIPVYLLNRFTWNFHRVDRPHVTKECISLLLDSHYLPRIYNVTWQAVRAAEKALVSASLCKDLEISTVLLELKETNCYLQVVVSGLRHHMLPTAVRIITAIQTWTLIYYVTSSRAPEVNAHIRFEVFTKVKGHIAVVWVMTQRSIGDG
jgi:hypothetical protein